MSEHVSNRYKLPDWTEQFDDCDVCECCEQLTKMPLRERLSEAIIMLYTHEIITSAGRDRARNRLMRFKENDDE